MKLSENSIRSSIQEMILDQHALGKAPRDSKRLLEYIAGEYQGKAKSEMWGFSRKQFAKSESWLVGDIDAGTVTIGGEEMSCHAAMTKGYERSPASHIRGKSIDISNTGNIKDMLLQLREKGSSISKLASPPIRRSPPSMWSLKRRRKKRRKPSCPLPYLLNPLPKQGRVNARSRHGRPRLRDQPE